MTTAAGDLISKPDPETGGGFALRPQRAGRRVRLTLVQPEHRYESSLCAPCGGKCCQKTPGSTHPEQWGATRDEMVRRLAEAFATGRWAIDWWDGDPRPWTACDAADRLGSARYVRPAMGALGSFGVLHPAWGNEAPCTFLRANGCELEHDDRPLGCRALEPDAVACQPRDGGKRGAALEWIPYQAVIEEAFRIGVPRDERMITKEREVAHG